LVFQWPRPPEAEVAVYYAGSYGVEYEVPAMEDRYRGDVEEARVRAQRLRPFLDLHSRVLEVGSGSGAFLEAARPYAGAVTGVEPDMASRRFVTQRLGIDVYSQVEEVPPNLEFDLIAMFHVLEHLPDPPRSLKHLAQRLAPGGRLAVEVPNVDDALLTLYSVPAFASFYYQKAHLYYFSSTTLQIALGMAGLAGGIEGLQRYGLSNHLRWMLSGEPGGQGYYASVLSPSVEAAYAGALIRAGKADTLWAVARIQAPAAPTQQTAVEK
jgi:SAM-dependent methyltransferase